MMDRETNGPIRKTKRALLTASIALACVGSAAVYRAAFSQSPSDSLAETTFFPHSQFKIPFNVDARGTQPSQVQLWVSTDQGATWQIQGTAAAGQKHFDFRAAAEGLYLFSVQTLDENGRAFPSPQPPLRIFIDTTRPQIELRPDVNANGQVVVDIRISEDHLKAGSVRLRYRTDQQAEWQEVMVENIVVAGQIYEGQVILDLKNCREVGFIATVADEAANVGEASAQYSMPRTAAVNQDIKLASQRNGSNETTSQTGLAPMPGAVAWQNTPVAQLQQLSPQSLSSPAQQPTQPLNVQVAPQAAAAHAGGWQVSGQLAGTNGPGLSLNPSQNPVASGPSSGINITPTPGANSQRPSAFSELQSEELPAPQALEGNLPNRSLKPQNVDKPYVEKSQVEKLIDKNLPANELQTNRAMRTPSHEASELERSTSGQAFHSNSRSFSLDYSLNAAAGSALADVELWGTEDGGSTWQKWGSDPDRQSPFDVQVVNDGLFGFRMVIVSQNGKVTNRPKDGDSGDAWINVDTSRPNAKITRAVYGDGHEAGMLVIDYTCTDDHLHERPITLAYSETQSGPWVTIASGLKNTGLYLWKADSNLPETVFLRLESVDKAGNVGTYVLDLPINVQGLMPRGRIQGFRPISNPQ